MKILVSGATGFIGSHVVGAALAQGHTVRALCRPGSRARVALQHEPLWVHGGLADCPDEVLMDTEVLVHLAAQGVSPQAATLAELFACNVHESLVLWTRAAQLGVSHLVLCGSCFEYGRSANRYLKIPVDAPLEPVSAYGASKAAATMSALGWASAFGLPVTVLRPFTVYGEGQHPTNFWPALRDAARAGRDFAMSPGEQVRDFTPVAHVASSFVDALARRPPPGAVAIRNLGTGEARSLRDFALAWWTQWMARGRLRIGEVAYRADEIMRYVPEIEECPQP